MKNIFGKFSMIVLSFLFISGSLFIIHTNLFQKNVNNNQYVFSKFSHKGQLDISQRNNKTGNIKNSFSLPSNTQTSSNWSGYISKPTSNAIYTSISGNWTIPNVSSNNNYAVAAQWIGLGGVSSSDLLQMGTMEEIKDGQTTVEVFWEKLPDASQNIMSVPIGSTISAKIYKSSNSNSEWTLTFTATYPNGTAQTKTINTTLNSSYENEIGKSAEWISEDPSNGYSKLLPLANMGTVKYQGTTVNGNLLNSSTNTVELIALVSNGNILIYPSEIGSDGESFTTTSIDPNSDLNSNANSDFRHQFREFPMTNSMHNRIRSRF